MVYRDLRAVLDIVWFVPLSYVLFLLFLFMKNYLDNILKYCMICERFGGESPCGANLECLSYGWPFWFCSLFFEYYAFLTCGLFWMFFWFVPLSYMLFLAFLFYEKLSWQHFEMLYDMQALRGWESLWCYSQDVNWFNIFWFCSLNFICFWPCFFIRKTGLTIDFNAVWYADASGWESLRWYS